MTEQQFDDGYWYADELKAFAKCVEIPHASGMRKDQLEKALKSFLRAGAVQTHEPVPAKTGVKDFVLGLRPDLPIVSYTSNQVTKAFILNEARKSDPCFRPKSGTRYLLNRWREEQIALGMKLTYGNLVQHALKLNQEKIGPLRMEHGRYINFISDFLAANPGVGHRAAVAAWAEIKDVSGPKTYDAWRKYNLDRLASVNAPGAHKVSKGNA